MARDNIDGGFKGVDEFSAAAAGEPFVLSPIALAQQSINRASIATIPSVPFILLSAPIGSGKSPLARQLAGRMGAVLIEKDLLVAPDNLAYKTALAKKIIESAAQLSEADLEQQATVLMGELKDSLDQWCAACLNKGFPVVSCTAAVDSAFRIIQAIRKSLNKQTVVEFTTLNLCLTSDSHDQLSMDQQAAARLLAAICTLKEIPANQEIPGKAGKPNKLPTHVTFSGGLNKTPMKNLLATFIKSSKEVPAPRVISVIRAEIATDSLSDVLKEVVPIVSGKGMPTDADALMLWEKASVFNKLITRCPWDEAKVTQIFEQIAQSKLLAPKGVIAADASAAAGNLFFNNNAIPSDPTMAQVPNMTAP